MSDPQEPGSEQSNPRSDRDWFGAYAPAEHVTEASGGIAYNAKCEVEDVAAARLDSGGVLVDVDTIYGDTVRLVYDEDHLSALAEMLLDHAEEQDPEIRTDGGEPQEPGTERSTATFTVVCDGCGQEHESVHDWLNDDPCMPDRVDDGLRADGGSDEQDDEELPFRCPWEVGVQKRGDPDSWQHFHPKAKSEQEARRRARSEARDQGWTEPEVYMVTGPWRPDDPARVGRELIEEVFDR